MVSIKWCLKQKLGIRILEPNTNICNSYLMMAEESIEELERIKTKIWIATASYYTFYYSLYALIIRLGIKCEIHSCSLEFMKEYLKEFYDEIDIELINKAFFARNDLQYYTNRPVEENIINEIKIGCKDFYIKTKDIIIKLTEEQINNIRDRIQCLKED
ncbi:hypothetical protein HY498_04290 [Candidatus Woesearchaeota archaeon]|nr:hypothetical protein [Candidatus Woesearchaeota archaeon]